MRNIQNLNKVRLDSARIRRGSSWPATFRRKVQAEKWSRHALLHDWLVEFARWRRLESTYDDDELRDVFSRSALTAKSFTFLWSSSLWSAFRYLINKSREERSHRAREVTAFLAPGIDDPLRGETSCQKYFSVEISPAVFPLRSLRCIQIRRKTPSTLSHSGSCMQNVLSDDGLDSARP